MPDQCQSPDTLPCIMENGLHFVVRVPGSVYQPLLIRPPEDSAESVSPGAMNETEARFVRDLIACLCPDGNYPDLRHPLKWNGKEIWLRRNLDKHDDSFRLRMEGSDWFYPDFLIWIVDHEKRIQTLGFVDPKGFREGVEGGWGDYKVLATLYQPHVIEQSLKDSGDALVLDGDTWTFRIRGILLSVSSVNDGWATKFQISSPDGALGNPTMVEFQQGRIFFQPASADATTPDKGYIRDILNALESDLPIDGLMRRCLSLLDGGTADDDDLQAMKTLYNGKPDSEFLGYVIRARIARL